MFTPASTNALWNYDINYCYFFQEQLQDVHNHCVNAEPHHGELWCQVSKKIENWRFKPTDILPLVAAMCKVPA